MNRISCKKKFFQSTFRRKCSLTCCFYRFRNKGLYFSRLNVVAFSIVFFFPPRLRKKNLYGCICNRNLHVELYVSILDSASTVQVLNCLPKYDEMKKVRYNLLGRNRQNMQGRELFLTFFFGNKINKFWIHHAQIEELQNYIWCWTLSKNNWFPHKFMRVEKGVRPQNSCFWTPIIFLFIPYNKHLQTYSSDSKFPSN